MKYVLVTGGVVSGLGKGITASSIGVLLQSCGLRVTCIKIGDLSFIVFNIYSDISLRSTQSFFSYSSLDPYLNYDAGTISPYEHGEVFVLEDGSEVNIKKPTCLSSSTFSDLKTLKDLCLMGLDKRWILILETTRGF